MIEFTRKGILNIIRMWGYNMSKIGVKILKMIGTISLISMILLLLLNVIVFKMLFASLQTDAKDIAIEAVNVIDGDKLERVIQNKSMDSDEYKEIEQSMISFKSDNNIRYFYTLAKDEDDSAYILVDAALADKSELGEEYGLEEEMKEAFQGTPSFNEEPTKDEYGTFISGYAPIKNSNGKVIAIVGVDKDVANYIYIKTRIISDSIIASIVILILSVLSSIIFSKKITSNVNQIKDVLNAMKQGDLTVSINVLSKDELQAIAEEINDFREGTAETLRLAKSVSYDVMQQSETLSAVSQELAASSQVISNSVEEVSKGSNDQAGELMNISNAISDFGLKIDQSVINIEKINSKMRLVDLKAIDSSKELKVLEDSIKDTNLSFADVREKIQGLGTELSKISEITDVIKSISDQTNLLALNAAIESARAGESGRGFSVVAEEIRKLAEQSKISSLSISDLISNISNDSVIVVKTSEEMNNKLNSQMQVIDKSMSSFKDIIENIEEIMPQITDVNSSIAIINSDKESIIKSVEVAASLAEEVLASTEEITASSQDFNASSQEVAASSVALSGKAQSMIGAINKFKI